MHVILKPSSSPYSFPKEGDETLDDFYTWRFDIDPDGARWIPVIPPKPSPGGRYQSISRGHQISISPLMVGGSLHPGLHRLCLWNAVELD